jgi:DNA-binding NarL/FixJ family response regulator
MDRPRVVLADDHAELLDGLRRLLEPQFEVVGTAQDGQAVIAVANDLKPDVLILDISMPRVSGIEAARKLRQQDPAAKIVFLTMHQDPALVEQALDTGASGYVLKVAARTELVTAINEVLAGRSFISSRLRHMSARWATRRSSAGYSKIAGIGM